MNDKLLHFIGGAVIALIGAFFSGPLAGLALAVVAGALKEIYDHLHPDGHTVELWDFLATAAGGLLAFGVLR